MVRITGGQRLWLATMARVTRTRVGARKKIPLGKTGGFGARGRPGGASRRTAGGGASRPDRRPLASLHVIPGARRLLLKYRRFLAFNAAGIQEYQRRGNARKNAVYGRLCGALEIKKPARRRTKKNRTHDGPGLLYFIKLSPYQTKTTRSVYMSRSTRLQYRRRAPACRTLSRL